MHMKFFTLAVFCIALPLVGCGLAEKKSDSLSTGQPQTKATDLIATDFVNALRQLSSLPSNSTTVELQTSEKNDPFYSAMQSALRQAGYGIRWIDHEGSDTLFQYRTVSEDEAGSVSRDTYELAVGAIEMRRAYAVDANRVQPISPLYVRGTDASGLELNDGIFNSSGSVQVAEASVAPVQSDQEHAAVDINAVPLNPPLDMHKTTSSATLGLRNTSPLNVPPDANPLDPNIGRAASGRLSSIPLTALPRVENVFELGVSNFEDALSEHSILNEQVLTFANDSMRLGERNKRLVEQMVNRFDPKTDVFSVVGCSMGPTQVKGGNAALALGRAGRVAEALRFAGVDDAHILDEGCWAADEAIERLPRRGVVLTLNRRS